MVDYLVSKNLSTVQAGKEAGFVISTEGEWCKRGLDAVTQKFGVEKVVSEVKICETS